MKSGCRGGEGTWQKVRFTCYRGRLKVWGHTFAQTHPPGYISLILDAVAPILESLSSLPKENSTFLQKKIGVDIGKELFTMPRSLLLFNSQWERYSACKSPRLTRWQWRHGVQVALAECCQNEILPSFPNLNPHRSHSSNWDFKGKRRSSLWICMLA